MLIPKGALQALFMGMIKEEWRLQKSFVGGFGALFFPVLIGFISFFLVLLLPRDVLVEEGTLLVAHLVMLFYGILIGGIALIGERIMTRRLGSVNMLLSISQVQPIHYRRVMGVFYVKEMAFYLLYSNLPLTIGLVSGGLVSGIGPMGTLAVSLTMYLTFLMGMSLSFLTSSVMVIDRFLGVMTALLIFLLGAMVWPLELIAPGLFLHPLGFWYDPSPLPLAISLLEILLISSVAIFITREKRRPRTRFYPPSLISVERRFKFFKRPVLISKEWLELMRSGTLMPVLTGFSGPLLAVYGMMHMLSFGFGADLSFNCVLYGSLVGFFGVMTYSWLNNVEQNQSFDYIPVSVPMVIRSKLVLYFVITSVITTLYVLLISVLGGDLMLFPIALLASHSNNIFTVFVTAYLTGTRTNTMLLDGKTLMKFSMIVTPPLIVMVILSFSLVDGGPLPAVLIGALSLLLIGISLFLGRGLDSKWGKAPFGM